MSRNDPLRQLADDLVKDPNARQKDKINALLQLSSQTDRRLDILNGRVANTEEVANQAASHPFHQVSNKNLVVGIILGLAYTIAVVKESRDLIIGFLFP